MKVLQICHKPPSPIRDGGSIAMFNVTNGLLNLNHEVRILAIETYKHLFNKAEFPISFLDTTQLKAVYIDTKLHFFDIFLNLFNSKPYNTERFKSKVFEKTLIDLLLKEKVDIIQLESIFTANYIDVIRKYSTAKIVLRSHSVEHKIWEDKAKNTKWFKKIYHNVLAKRLKKFEAFINSKVDCICTITEIDKQLFQNQNNKLNIHTIPFGIDLNNFKVKSFQNFHLFHIGSMDWQSNTEGIQWFMDDIWPKISNAHPNLILHLAGRKMNVDILKSHHLNIEIVGEVTSSKDFMDKYGIMVVPLLHGSGMRVKIIEAMALGKAIISTTIGAEGINCTNNKNILIANTAVEFLEAISRLVYTPNLIEEISKNARTLVEEEYENVNITKKLVTVYKSIT